MRKGQEWLAWIAVIVTLATGGINARAQGFGVLHSFTNSTTDGAFPEGQPLLIGPTIYGVTYNGGSSGNGAVYQVSTNGAGFGVVYSFLGGANGANPFCSLVSTGSALYGMSFNGGVNDGGVVFGVSTNGSRYVVLHTFLGGSSDGLFPFGSLTLAGSTLYGMTANGGTNDAGVVFKINADGTSFSVVHSFAGGATDGSFPNEGVVVGGSTLYGTTFYGGSNDLGIVFALDTAAVSNAFKILHHFAGGTNDGANPSGPLTLNGSTLYGITTGGGTNDLGAVYKVSTSGTGYTVLHHFVGGTNDGAFPQFGPLVVTTNSVLYGTAQGGGPLGRGVLFQLNTDGTGFTILHSFSTNATDGAFPSFGPILSGSVLYGATVYGGSNDIGVVYGDPVTPGTNSPSTNMCVTVYGSNSLGVVWGTVTNGQAYTYSASGCVGVNANSFFTNPDGVKFFPDCSTFYSVADAALASCICPDPGFLRFSLVGKVGGSCIQLGSSGGFVAPASGPLTLYVNDDVFAFGDNSGSFSVCISAVNCTNVTTNVLTQVSAIQITNNNLVITVPSVVCMMYQLQASDEMVPTNWINIAGALQAGTGGPIQFIQPIGLCGLQTPCLQQPPNLVGWWPGDGSAVDMVGGNNGVMSNGVTYVTDGEVCQAFSFTTNHAGVVVGNPANLQLQTFTIETWFRRHSSTLLSNDPSHPNNGVLFGYGHFGYGFLIELDGTGNHRLCLTQIDNTNVTGGPDIIDTMWHHGAVTKSGNTVVFYYDGTAYPTTYTASFTFTTSAAIGIRADNMTSGDNSCAFNGDIDEVSVYSRALDPAEIVSIYNAGAAGKCKPSLPDHRFYRVDEFP